MTDQPMPRFPFGAVYFRKSNPPPEDWARDYAVAAEDGMTAFRHWFLWSAIEVAPGEYDWADYDRQLDLAAEQGIKTVIAEMITAAPEWAYRRYAHARLEMRDGRKVESQMSGSCVTGGFPGLCLDHDDYRELAGRFLRALVERYRDHPGLGGYDVWNECNFGHEVCYCPATAEAFRAWLRRKYGDVRALGQAWYRHSLAEWDDVTPPRTAGPYPDTLDWLQFRIDDAYAHMRWRVELIRAMDPHHPITAHGVAGTLTTMAPGGADDWRAAAEVDSYGLTWVACRKGDEPWKQWHAVDLTRAASRGKDYWHAEAQGGPLWMQPQVIGRPRDDGRIAEPEDMRLWHLTSFAGGARGLLYPRWRPLLDGPLFGAFGPYGMDGSRTARSRMTSRLARWVAAPEQEALWRSRPVRGEVGIVYAPETQLFTYAQQGSTALYADAMMGAYRGFYDLNVQADWVHIDHIDEYDTLYLPLPVMLTQTSADRLIAWVAAGGTLISEGCPGYFGDRGRVGVTQPNLGLDALFGVRQTYVEFTPDILGGLRYNLDGVEAPGGIFMQAYEPFDSGAGAGTPVGWYAGGRVAAVDHAYGRGRTRLLGTMTGAGHGVQGNGRPAFDALARWAGITPHVRCSDPQVVARLHDGEGGVYLWVANPTRRDRPVRLRLGGRWAGLRPALSLWGAEATVEGDDMVLIAGARDVAVLVLV